MHKKFIIFILLLIVSIPSFANNLNTNNSAELFISNNTNEISLVTAYNRLEGKEQETLQNDIANIAKEQYMQINKFEDILGVYRMSKNHKITADNTEKLSINPETATNKILNVASILAKNFKQESVAVFIPADNSTHIAETTLKLTSHRYSIDEALNIIHKKLPEAYSQAISLHLESSKCREFHEVVVTQIDWLGNNIAPKKIKNAFPDDRVIPHLGYAYLIFSNGKKEKL